MIKVEKRQPIGQQLNILISLLEKGEKCALMKTLFLGFTTSKLGTHCKKDQIWCTTKRPESIVQNRIFENLFGQIGVD